MPWLTGRRSCYASTSARAASENCVHPFNKRTMPADICFHISSAEAAKNDHGDATALTLPITPALHIPSTAQPTASLRSLCFTNTLANATASDGTSSCTLGLFSGSGHPQFTNGSAAPDPWIGLAYTDASGAAQTVVAPLIDPGGPWTYTGVSTTAAFHSFSVANLVDMITFTTRHTWADAKWLKDTGQIADATAAHAPHLPNSTVKGVLAMGIDYPTLVSVIATWKSALIGHLRRLAQRSPSRTPASPPPRKSVPSSPRWGTAREARPSQCFTNTWALQTARQAPSRLYLSNKWLCASKAQQRRGGSSHPRRTSS